MKESAEYIPASKESFQFHDGDSDDSRDSDAKQLFELPKRKLVRPVSSSLRRKLRPHNRCWIAFKDCCRLFVTVTLPMLIAVFIMSTILCLTFLLVGVAGLKQEMSLLKIKLKNVDAAEGNFISKREHLRKEFQQRLEEIINHKDQLKELQNAVKVLSTRLDHLNTTVHKYHDRPVSKLSLKLVKVNQDIDKLKTGMADTGADIERLDANGKKMKDGLVNLKHSMNSVDVKLYNMSVQLSLIENKPLPTLITTPKTLVVTMTPDEDLPVKRKEMKQELKKLELKQTLACKHEASLYAIKFEELKNYMSNMNETYSDEISYLHHEIAMMGNRTLKGGLLIANISSKQNATKTTKQSLAKPSPAPKVTLARNSSSIPILQITKPNLQAHRVNKTSTNKIASGSFKNGMTPTSRAKKTQSVKKKVVGVAKPKRSYNEHDLEDLVDDYETKDRSFHQKHIPSNVKENIKPLLREYIKRLLNPHSEGDLPIDNREKNSADNGISL